MNFKQKKTKQHLLGWGQDFWGNFQKTKSKPNKKTGSVNGDSFVSSIFVMICLIHGGQALSHRTTPRPVLISWWRDTFVQVDVMASINYASHCCDKYPGQTQFKEDRVCFSSQFRVEFSLMRAACCYIAPAARKQRAVSANAQLTVTLLLSLGSQPTEWCCPHSRWVLPSHLM